MSSLTPAPAGAHVRSVADVYQERIRRFADQESRLARCSARLAHARGATFLGSALCLGAGWLAESLQGVWRAAGCFLVLVFLALVVLHHRVAENLARRRQLRKINEHSLARLERRWNDAPYARVRLPDQNLPLARDLDLFGRASLFQLICTASTPMGVATLRDWLLRPADPATVARRQESAAELAPQLELRQELALRGQLLSAGDAGPHSLLQWVEGEPWLGRRPWLQSLARLLPATVLVTTALTLWKTLPPEAGGTIALAAVIANVLISVAFTGRIHDIFDNISSRHGEIDRYRELFELMYGLPAASEDLVQIKRQVSDEKQGALRQVRRLRRIVYLANLRRSPITSVFYLVLQIILLWDFHVLALLERWQRRWGPHVGQWFEAIGRLEAIGSLASLAHDHPDWVFPRIEPKSPVVLEAAALGHPLLPNCRRVANDVRLGPPGTFLLVTGSNMSGKSTLLRSLGVNAVLAQAGAPVCAARLRMPPLIVTTSMRTQDSLEDGVSSYMAELKRLKQIVEEARECADRKDWTLLYLLDEILQGTNSAERHIAVERVLAHLIAQGAIGAVSTHDLTLADSPQLASACQAVHFRESFRVEGGREIMTFDYQLRPGVASTTNALKLLKIVGLAGEAGGDL